MHTCVFKEDARKAYLDSEGKVDLGKIQARWTELSKIKVSLGNKYFTPAVVEKVKGLSDSD